MDSAVADAVVDLLWDNGPGDRLVTLRRCPLLVGCLQLGLAIEPDLPFPGWLIVFLAHLRQLLEARTLVASSLFQTMVVEVVGDAGEAALLLVAALVLIPSELRRLCGFRRGIVQLVLANNVRLLCVRLSERLLGLLVRMRQVKGLHVRIRHHSLLWQLLLRHECICATRLLQVSTVDDPALRVAARSSMLHQLWRWKQFERRFDRAISEALEFGDVLWHAVSALDLRKDRSRLELSDFQAVELLLRFLRPSLLQLLLVVLGQRLSGFAVLEARLLLMKARLHPRKRLSGRLSGILYGLALCSAARVCQ